MQDQIHSLQSSNLHRKRSSVALHKTKSRNETVMKNLLDEQQKPDEQQSQVNSFGDSQLNVIFQDFNNLKRSSTKVAEPKIGEILKDVIYESRYQQNGYVDNLQSPEMKNQMKNKEQTKNLQNMVQTILVASRSQGGWSQFNDEQKNFKHISQMKKELQLNNKVLKKDDPQKCYKIPSISKCLEFKILPKTSKILQNLCIQMANNPQNEINYIENYNMKSDRPISFRNTESNYFKGENNQRRLVTQEKKKRQKKRLFSQNELSPHINGSQPEIKTFRNSNQSTSQHSLFLQNQGSEQTFFHDLKKADEALKNNCKKIVSHQNNQYLQIPINNHKLKLNPSDEKYVILSKNAQQNEIKIINQKHDNFTQSVDQNLYSLESNSEMLKIAPQFLKISQYENTLQSSQKIDENKKDLKYNDSVLNFNENKKLHISNLDPFQIFDEKNKKQKNENFDSKFNSLQIKEDIQNKFDSKKQKIRQLIIQTKQKSNQDLKQFYNNRNDWQKDLPVKVKHNLVNNFYKEKPSFIRHQKIKFFKKQQSKNEKKHNNNSLQNIELDNNSNEFNFKNEIQIKQVKKQKSLLKIQMHIDLQEIGEINKIDTIPQQNDEKDQGVKTKRQELIEQKFKYHKKAYEANEQHNTGGMSVNPSNHTMLRSRQGNLYSQERFIEATNSSKIDHAQKSFASKQITPLNFDQSNQRHIEGTLSRAQAESQQNSSQKKVQDTSHNYQFQEKRESKHSYVLETNINNFDQTYIKDNDSYENQEQVIQIQSPSILQSPNKHFDYQQQNSFSQNIKSQKSRKSIEFQNMAILQKIGLKKNNLANDQILKDNQNNIDILDQEQQQYQYQNEKLQKKQANEGLIKQKKKIKVDQTEQDRKIEIEEKGNQLFDLQNISQKNYQTVYISNEDKKEKAIIFSSSKHNKEQDQKDLNNNFANIQIEYRTLGGELNVQNDKNIEESSYDILLSNNKKQENTQRGKSASLSRFTRKEYKLFQAINRLHSAHIHLNCHPRQSIDQGQQTLTQEQIDKEQKEFQNLQKHLIFKSNDINNHRKYKCGSQNKSTFKESNQSAIQYNQNNNRNSDHFKQIQIPQQENGKENSSIVKYQFEPKFNLQFSLTQRGNIDKNKIDDKSNSQKDFRKQMQSLQIQKIKESMPTGHFRRSFAAFQQINLNPILFENQDQNDKNNVERKQSNKALENKVKVKIQDFTKKIEKAQQGENQLLNEIAFRKASQKSIFKSVNRKNSDRKLSLNGSDICLKQQLKDIESYAEDIDQSPDKFDQFYQMQETFTLPNQMQPIELKQYEINQQMQSTHRSGQIQQSSTRSFFIRKKQAHVIKSLIQIGQGSKQEINEAQTAKFQNQNLKEQIHKQKGIENRQNNGICTVFEMNLDQQKQFQNTQQVFQKKKKILRFYKKSNEEVEQKMNKKHKDEQKMKKFELTSLEYNKKKMIYQDKKSKKEVSIVKDLNNNQIQQYSLLNSINIPMMNTQKEKQQNSRSIVIIGRSDNMGLDTQRIEVSMNNNKQFYKEDELDWEDYPQQYIQSSLTDL